MNPREGRCGALHCQWCGRAKILIDRHDLTKLGMLTRMPDGAVFLCPRCDEAAQGAGPLATLIARVAARHLGARRSKEN